VIQYWIQTPIENARETITRFLNDNTTPLTAYEDFVPYYNVATEVVSFNLKYAPSYDLNTIYFGDVYVPNTETLMVLSVFDTIGTIETFSSINKGVNSGKYPYIIFNEVTSIPDKDCYFAGYKFFIDNKPPQYSYLLTEAGEIIETEAGDQIYL
jgi:hypothetical protein